MTDNDREGNVADNESDPSEVDLDLGASEPDDHADEPDLSFGDDADDAGEQELSAADLFGEDAEESEDPGRTGEGGSGGAPTGEAAAEDSDHEQAAAEPGVGGPARGLDDDFEINLNFDVETEEAGESAPPVDFDAEVEISKAMGELRERLEAEWGDWYVVHTYAGMENRVKQNIEQRVSSLNMEDYIYEVIVPTETVVEMKNGNKKEVTRVFLPGYVLVRMDLTDESWGCIRHTPAVTGFVGNANDPMPLTLDEVESMLRPAIVARISASHPGKGKRPPKKVEVTDYQVGDAIMVTEGPFAGVPGIITEINPNTQRLIATVEFMGRDTPVDLTFPQIQKA